MDHPFKVTILEEVTIGTEIFRVQRLGRGCLLSALDVQGRPIEVHASGHFCRLVYSLEYLYYLRFEVATRDVAVRMSNLGR
jgi:hypothetical protein